MPFHMDKLSLQPSLRANRQRPIPPLHLHQTCDKASSLHSSLSLLVSQTGRRLRSVSTVDRRSSTPQNSMQACWWSYSCCNPHLQSPWWGLFLPHWWQDIRRPRPLRHLLPLNLQFQATVQYFPLACTQSCLMSYKVSRQIDVDSV